MDATGQSSEKDWKSSHHISFLRCLHLPVKQQDVSALIYEIFLHVKPGKEGKSDHLYGRLLLLVPHTVENRWWWTTLTKDSCSCASEALDAVGASVQHCGAETRLSGRQHPDEEQTGEKRQLEGTKPTDEQTSTYAQACFTPQRTNSSFWYFDTLISPKARHC